MLEKLSEKFSNKLLEEKVIDENRKEVYTYGFMIAFSTMAAILSIIILSIIFSDFWSGIIFVTVFLLLRTFSGGYHSDTYLKCFIITNSVYIITYWASRLLYFYKNNSTYIILLIVSALAGLYLFFNKPVVNKNNLISEKTVAKNRKVLRVFTVLITTISIIGLILCNYFKVSYFYFCLIILTVVAVNILISIVHFKKH